MKKLIFILVLLIGVLPWSIYADVLQHAVPNPNVVIVQDTHSVILIAGTYEVQQIKARVNTLRWCIGLLVKNLERVLIQLLKEPVTPAMREVVSEALDACTEILKALKYR